MSVLRYLIIHTRKNWISTNKDQITVAKNRTDKSKAAGTKMNEEFLSDNKDRTNKCLTTLTRTLCATSQT